MAIQHRRGIYDRFDPSRLVAGEWAIVLSGDTSASDGRAAYICFAAGTVKRIATYEDMAESIANANEELIEELTAQITAATTAANTAASNANTKATAANTAASSANTAASAANTAASNANSKATAANTAASSANSAASSATTAAGRANTAANAANAAATSATEATESVSDAAYRAETAATSANTAAGSANAAAQRANTAAGSANAAAQRANTAADNANAATSEANAAIEAMGDISELAVPEMTSNVRGGAKVGGSTQVVNEKLEIKLSESATGTSVTTGSTSALRELQVHGQSVQDGTPTPDAPVEVQVVQGRNLANPTIDSVTNLGLTITKLNDNSFKVSGTSTTNSLPSAKMTSCGVLPAGNYTATLKIINGSVTGSDGIRCRVGKGSSATYVTGSPYISSGDSSITFTADGTSEYFAAVQVAAANTVVDCVVGLQLEAGSTATPYVPYGCIALDIKGQNLTPWFSAGCDCPDAAGYWHTLVSPNYTDGTEVTDTEGRKVITAMGDGWAHVIIDSRSSAGNQNKNAYVNTFVKLGKLADIVPGGTYTWLAEVRNMTWVGASDGSRLTICPSIGRDTMDKLSTSNVAAMRTNTDAVMRTKVVAKNDFSGVTQDTRGYMFIPTGCYAEFDVRVSLYAGEYTGPYIPYAMPVPPIDLQGNTLASLPDGTRDELHVDSAGHCVLTKNVGKTTIGDSLAFGNTFTDSSTMGGNCTRITMNMSNFPTMKSTALNATNSYMSIAVAGSTSASTRPYPGVYSKTSTSGVYLTLPSTLTSTSDVNAWLTANNFDFFYPLAEATTIDLGYIDPPAIPSGSVVTVSASLTPTFDLACWTEHASELADITDAITTLAGMVIGDEQESIASSIAPVEDSTASDNHAVGDYLMLGARLYRVTTAIASGERIIPGTNVTGTTVMSEIVSLLS